MKTSNGLPIGNMIMQEQIDMDLQSALKAGLEAVQNGQIDVAQDIYQNLLVMEPHNAEVHNCLGVVYGIKEEVNNAEKHVKLATRIDPNKGIYHRNFGEILFQKKRYRRAIRAFETALKLDPSDVQARYKLALVFGARGNVSGYESQLQSILDEHPDHFTANNDLGCFLITKHRFKDAVKLLKMACSLPEAVASTHVNLGNAYVLLNQLTSALTSFKTAVQIEPENPVCLMGRATVERNLGDLTSAFTHAEKAALIIPESAPALNLLGTIHKEMGEYDEALQCFNRSLVLDKHFAAAQVNRGFIELLSGNWTDGFVDVECRMKDPNYAKVREDLACPRWEGTEIQGKSIFLHAEQGFGDTLQYFRFAKTVADLGGSVTVEVQPELASLLSGTYPSVDVIAVGQKVPETDWYSPLLSLPHLLNVNTEADFTSKPYLSAPVLSDGLGRRVHGDGKFCVGINWAGSSGHKEDYKRSIDPLLFSSLKNIDGVRFINLHFGDSGKKPDIFGDDADIHNFVHDFSDSAAIVNQLDLVITVDTATVHLAGALGKTCWALIPFVPDWRWMKGRADSSWYKSVRLFRQPVRGDWSSVMDLVGRELSEFSRETSAC